MSEGRTKGHLTLLPCLHYYLAVQYNVDTVVAVCGKCRRKAIHTIDEWVEWKALKQALDKPMRV